MANDLLGCATNQLLRETGVIVRRDQEEVGMWTL